MVEMNMFSCHGAAVQKRCMFVSTVKTCLRALSLRKHRSLFSYFASLSVEAPYNNLHALPGQTVFDFLSQ